MKVLDFNPESLAPDDYCSTWEAVVRFLDGVFQARKRIRRGRFLMVYIYIYIFIHVCGEYIMRIHWHWNHCFFLFYVDYEGYLIYVGEVFF